MIPAAVGEQRSVTLQTALGSLCSLTPFTHACLQQVWFHMMPHTAATGCCLPGTRLDSLRARAFIPAHAAPTNLAFTG
jgi:hypothetical protein